MSKELKKNEDDKYIPMTSVHSGAERQIKEDVYYYTSQIANLVFVGRPGDKDWVLIDAGMPRSGDDILEAAENRFGKGTKPAAIILTHGHFDHVGGIIKLIEEWQVPVYAHPMEFPFLTGEKSYPEPDPSVEGGMLAKISAIYPHEPINIEQVLQPLPEDNSVPHLPGWKWIHTPGHTPGHVSFFRESDKVLIAGDAFVTVKQDSMYRVLVQKKEVHGPPVYLTPDWQASYESVKKLDSLNPAVAITGHGTAMEGQELWDGLKELVQKFDKIAVPDHGKFVKDEK